MAADSVGTVTGATARNPLRLGDAETAEISPGLLAVAHYGDPDAEYRSLGRACGLVDRLWVDHLELTGEDRGRFLNGMVTGDTRALATGEGRFVFFTSVQGRILAEARVTALSDRLLLELPAGCGEAIAEHLSRYIVADRVEIVPRPDLRALSLVGPDAWVVAARLAPGAEPPVESWSSLDVEWRGGTLALCREERLGAPAVTVRAADDGAQAAAERLLETEGDSVARPVGFVAAEALRAEAGLPRFGPDFGDERFPQEVGESDALDFEKGCYLGQEVVARIHYRGKVNYRLCGLRLGGDELPPPGSPVRLGGDEVGRSGTAARSPLLEAGIALAVLHRKAAVGAAVTVAGVAAEIVNLPFATASAGARP